MTHLSSWKSKFFTIVIGQTVSLIGSSAVQFALIWWLSTETASPMMLALAGLFAFLPQLVLGPFAGVWIDRLKRKYICIAADLFMGVVALVFSLCFVFGDPPYWSACAVLGVRSIGNVFHTPAIQSIIPMLVPKEELVRANGWSQFMQSGAFILGPVLGAAMYAALPLSVILLTDFAGAVIASVLMAIVKIPELKHDAEKVRHFFQEMKEGALVFLKNPRIFILSIATMLSMIFFLPVSSYYPLMTSDYFAATAWHASLVELVYAVGMMLSAVIFSAVGQIKRKILVSYMGLLGVGVTCTVCGVVPPQMWAFWVFAAACCLLGASANVYNIPFMAYLQENIAPEALGRVFSLIGSVTSLCMPLGLAISGPIAEKLGVNFWFLISGIATLIVTALCGAFSLWWERRK